MVETMDDQIKHFNSSNIADIQVHLDAALDNDEGSGDHWILMSCFVNYGFRTNSTMEAMNLAEEIIVKWHTFHK